MSTHPASHESGAQPLGTPQGVDLWHRVNRYISASNAPASTAEPFNGLALDLFRFQWACNTMYRAWCGHLGWTSEAVEGLDDWHRIPCLPVEAFKWGEVRSEGIAETGESLTFRTSGTTGQEQGLHLVRTPGLYRQSAVSGFSAAFGAPSDQGAVVLGLLPGYLERPDSSLVHMVHLLRTAGWIEPEGLWPGAGTPEGGFHLDDVEALFEKVSLLQESGREVVLIGVTWALVDASAAWQASGRPPLERGVHIAVTGGMKGRREEWVAERVRGTLAAGFGCPAIGGEYGMTELLSQAWSTSKGLYAPPPWMRLRLRRTDDPLAQVPPGSTGALDVVDLANIGSCCFLATQDLARQHQRPGVRGAAFELLGRFDHAEVRGCNLLVN